MSLSPLRYQHALQKALETKQNIPDPILYTLLLTSATREDQVMSKQEHTLTLQ